MSAVFCRSIRNGWQNFANMTDFFNVSQLFDEHDIMHKKCIIKIAFETDILVKPLFVKCPHLLNLNFFNFERLIYN